MLSIYLVMLYRYIVIFFTFVNLFWNENKLNIYKLISKFKLINLNIKYNNKNNKYNKYCFFLIYYKVYKLKIHVFSKFYSYTHIIFLNLLLKI